LGGSQAAQCWIGIITAPDGAVGEARAIDGNGGAVRPVCLSAKKGRIDKARPGGIQLADVSGIVVAVQHSDLSGCGTYEYVRR